MKKIAIILLLLVTAVSFFFIGRFSVHAEKIIRQNPVVLSIENPDKIGSIDFLSPGSDRMTLLSLRGDRIFNIASNERQWDVIVNWKDGNKSQPFPIITQVNTPVHLSIGSRIVRGDDVSMWKFVWLRMKN